MDEKKLTQELKNKINFMLHDIDRQYPGISNYKTQKQRPAVQSKRILYPESKPRDNPYIPD